MTAARTLFSSGSPYESVFGYSRVVKVGPFLAVSGTTAAGLDKPAGGDVYQQATEALRRVGDALRQAGSSLGDVVRTRVYLTEAEQFDQVAKAHAAAFADVRPATTVVTISALASPELLVEIEADAIKADEL